jgi:MSHA pilin protein MshA
MQKQKGFTLIELIIVIVILGILGVTAAPKFLSLSVDARESATTGLKGALSAGANLVYSQAALDGNESLTSQTTTVGGGDVTTDYGYPAVTSEFADELASWMDLDAGTTLDGSEEWYMSVTATDSDNSVAGSVTFELMTDSSNENCRVTYTPASSSSSSASVTADISDC